MVKVTFDYGEEPDFSDPEGYIDDIDDEELMPEIIRQQSKESDDIDSVPVVARECCPQDLQQV